MPPSHLPAEQPIQPPEGSERREIPPLARASDVYEFVSYASASVPAEREPIRAVIAEARGYADVVDAMIAECEASVSTDFSRAAIALSLLGEMRTEQGARYLLQLVQSPLPVGEDVPDAGNLEQLARAQLMAKAVQGLAYMGTDVYDQHVLRIAGTHEHVTVRAEAIRAYQYHHPDRDALLLEHVRPDEVPYVYRPHREAGTSPEELEAQIDRFRRMFPERIPPAPEDDPDAEPDDEPGSSTDDPPPSR